MPPEDRPRILVVDDDEDTRQLIAFALGASRFDVTEVVDGEAALVALREAAFDLVITDYDMPGLTGAEMLKRATQEGILGDAHEPGHPPAGRPGARALHQPALPRLAQGAPPHGPGAGGLRRLRGPLRGV